MRHKKIRLKEVGVEGVDGKEVEATAAAVVEVVREVGVEAEDEVIDDILKS